MPKLRVLFLDKDGTCTEENEAAASQGMFTYRQTFIWHLANAIRRPGLAQLLDRFTETSRGALSQPPHPKTIAKSPSKMRCFF